MFRLLKGKVRHYILVFLIFISLLSVMAERMWTYPELRYVFVNRFKLSPNELALAVNNQFHGGQDVRNAMDIERIKRGRTIFDRGESC